MARVPRPTFRSSRSVDHAGDRLNALKIRNERLSLVRSVVYTIGTLGGAIILGALIFSGLFRPTVVIEPITVPKTFADRGYTSEVLSRRLGDLIRTVQEEAKTLKELSQLREPQPDVQVPGLGLSLQTIRRYINELFGIVETRVSGEITCSSTVDVKKPNQGAEAAKVVEIACEGPDIRLELRTDHGSITRLQGLASSKGEVNELLRRGSEAIVKFMDPFVLASSSFEDESKACDVGQCEFVKTLALIEYCLDNKPDDDDKWALTLRGHILTRQHREDAIATYRRATELDPTFALAHYSLGNALRQVGRYKEAAKAYEAAAASRRGSVRLDSVYNNWGLTLLDLKDHTGAIEKYREAVKANSKFAQGHYNWGIALVRMRRDNDAIEQFSKAISINPRHAGAYNNHGNALFRLKRYDEAIQQYKQALLIEPNNEQMLQNLTHALASAESKTVVAEGL
jgi:tetratricopeptide (TPR) repeat protein